MCPVCVWPKADGRLPEAGIYEWGYEGMASLMAIAGISRNARGNVSA